MWQVWGRVKMHVVFWWGNLREETDLEDVGVDGKIILKWVLNKFFRSMDWTDLVEDRDRW